MKKFALAMIAASTLAIPAVALANDAPTAEAAHAADASKTSKVELKDGSWAQVSGDTVTVSKDGGKTWMPAPDGTWEAKDGSKLTTKGGKKAM